MAPIWGGSRVRLTFPWAGLAAGTKGTNKGRREGLPGALTLLIQLDDGRKVRVPVLALEPIEEEYVKDGIAWKTDIPESTHLKVIFTVEQADHRGRRYELRGHSMRWFIVRWPGVTAEVERTKFYPNQRLARQAFNQLITE